MAQNNRELKQWADMTAEVADIALLARVLNSDETGLAVLMDRHWQRLVRYSHSILDDSNAAKTVVRQVFVRLWERRETLGLAGSVLGLLFRMTRDFSFEEPIQGDTREFAIHKGANTGHLAGRSHDVQNDEIDSAIQAALAKLPQRRREVFVLVRDYGLSYIETAEALAVGPQTVANELRLALSNLHEALTPLFSDQLQVSA